MSLRVRFEPEAEAESREAALWYEAQRPGLGLEFLDAMEDALELLLRFPRAGSTVPRLVEDLPARRVPVRRFPYHLVYLLVGSEIHILAVPHDHRRPGYWLKRE